MENFIVYIIILIVYATIDSVLRGLQSPLKRRVGTSRRKKKVVRPQDKIKNPTLRRLRLSKTLVKDMVRHKFIQPIVGDSKDFSYQFPKALENYLLYKFYGSDLRDINIKLPLLLSNEEKVGECKEYLSSLRRD
jgi:hypothetical protein